MKLLAVNAADGLLAVLRPDVRHRADQGVADALLGIDLLELPSEPRVGGQIVKQGKQIQHIDLRIHLQVPFPGGLRPVVPKLPGGLPDRPLPDFSQLVDQISGYKTIQEGVCVSKVHHTFLFVCIHHFPSFLIKAFYRRSRARLNGSRKLISNSSRVPHPP